MKHYFWSNPRRNKFLIKCDEKKGKGIQVQEVMLEANLEKEWIKSVVQKVEWWKQEVKNVGGSEEDIRRETG